MDSNNWRPTQAEQQQPPPMGDGGDWRSQLQPDSRQKIVNKIVETLKRHLPVSGLEGLEELKKIAIRFEVKIYSAATSQSDYLRKISLKMLTIESKSQNTIPNAMPSNSSGVSRNPPDPGGEPIITIPDEVARRPLPLAPIPDDIPHHAGPFLGLDNPLLEQGLRRPQGGPGIDIIKAIVYGGLLESITSLSIIASAAGGDATTLNTVALGMANMFGGLILLFHSLRILKHEHATEHYIQELGRPGHFLLHATVAIISYIIFGLMAPIIYGFSFRKSDNKDFKLATLAAASFVSITVLSTAKAYVRNPPKSYIKTVLYYLCIGFMVSGLGYVAGDLINELLKKLGVFDPKSVVPEGGGDIQGLLASY